MQRELNDISLIKMDRILLRGIYNKSVKSHVSAKYAYLMRHCDFFLGVWEFSFFYKCHFEND